MAYRRSLSSMTVTRLSKQFNPTFGYIHHDNDSKQQSSSADLCQPGSKTHDGYYTSNIYTKTAGLGALFRDRSMLTSLPFGIGSTPRSYSSSIGEKGPDNVEYSTDVTETLLDNVVELASSQASAVSEVATAAADSFYPIAALQYFIDGVHSFTGLNWWASIALTTIIIRGVTVPLLINQLKCTTKLTLMRPRLEEIKQEMQDKAMEPDAVSEGKRRMLELFREYGVTPLAPLKGIFIQGPIFISFYLAISNMVEKVPSFKEGGAFWFTDLTTPDNLYIFPVLTALTFLITVECNVQEGLEGNPVAGTIKKFSRVFAALTVPITMVFPKGVFCYWITSNLFSLVYGLVIKRPDVKKLLNIPIIPEAPAKPASPSFMTPTPYKPMSQNSASLSTKEGSISSSSVISERLQALEKQVQERQKGKK